MKTSHPHEDRLDKSAVIFKQVRLLVDDHDDKSKCDSPAYGVKMAFCDIDRVGWAEGDIVYPSKSIVLESGGQEGILRVLCRGTHKANLDGVVEKEQIKIPIKVVTPS
jgi:hypothetical protein